MYSFESIEIDNVNKEEYYKFEKKSIFTTLPWINYLLEDNPKSTAVIVRISIETVFVGYFTGIKIKKAGIPIIGSPFPGMGTSWMGLDLIEAKSAAGIYQELIPYLFEHYKCLYIRISDRNISVTEASKHFRTTPADSLQLDIDNTDEGLFKVFKTDCRNFIHQFEKRGASLEIAIPNDDFVEHFYSQLIDVFDKQGMNPTWTIEKVKRLVNNLAKEDMVLCLQVKDPDGNYIASSVYPGFGNKFFFWAGASYRSGQHYRPNEYMIWSAIKYWRDRGVKLFDMVGVRDYKRKFGPEEIQYAIIEFARPNFLIKVKDIAQSLFYISLKWKHKAENNNNDTLQKVERKEASSKKNER